ncbi:MAG: glycoside hydrolase family 16 protein [Corynebacteriales bacterium]|nr:glycoside hydrolase family 16 protein [Mycobacteriales bacterium]
MKPVRKAYLALSTATIAGLLVAILGPAAYSEVTADPTPSAAPCSAANEKKSATSGGTTAAKKHNWGTPIFSEDFESLDKWELYGDYEGHAGNGQRLKKQTTVKDGIVTINGTEDGDTGGLAGGPAQTYGRWEVRAKAPATSSTDYHPVLILWPSDEGGNVTSGGGELDFLEITNDASRQNVESYLHGPGNNDEKSFEKKIDATKWHNWAIEWTPEKITIYVDGEEWGSTTNKSIQPSAPMGLTIQLDWFPDWDQDPNSSSKASFAVDWARVYALNSES